MSICRRVAQAKGINNHIYSPESLQEEDPQLERAAIYDHDKKERLFIPRVAVETG
jgi:hypothetical protein